MTSKSSTTTDDLLPNPHPGEILMEEFLRPFSLSQTAVAQAIGVPPRRINEIVLGPARDHRRHGSEIEPVFRDVGGFLPAASDRL